MPRVNDDLVLAEELDVPPAGAVTRNLPRANMR